jgi:hypothetical protein
MWVLKGSDPLVFINNIEFSPVNLVYQKITSHPEYSLENFLIETKSKINASVINPPQPQPQPEKISQPEKQISVKQSNMPETINKRLLFILAGIVGILLITFVGIFGYKIIKSVGISAFGIIASATSSNTNIPTLVTATTYSTNTQSPTVTLLPTYTPNPTSTPRPSQTPYLTYTQKATLTPTETQTPFVPTPTRTPTKVRTSVPKTPTNTNIPATEGPAATATVRPSPTITQPPPVVINSCEINPSSVPAGFNITLTFIVHFSAPGYGFSTEFQSSWPGQSGCSGTDTNGDGTADCNGSSGLLPDSTKVDVILRSSVGDCTVSYSSP